MIANDFMINDTGLESLCEKANTKEEFLQKTALLYACDFHEGIRMKRAKILSKFSPEESAQKMIQIIFKK